MWLLTPASPERDQIGGKTGFGQSSTARWERERGGLVEEANTYPSAIPGTSAPAPIRHFQLFWDTEPLSRVTWWLSGVCWRCSGSRFCAKGVKTLWGH